MSNILVGQIVTPNEPEFGIRVSGGNISLTYAQLSHWVKTCIAMMEFDSSLFSSHSIQWGRAQWSAKSGVIHYVVKLLGNWRSSAYERTWI